MPDYYPLIAGLTLEYAVSGRASGETLKIEVLQVAQTSGGAEAVCRQTAVVDGISEVTELILNRERDGVFAGGVKELALPPSVGSRWNVPPVEYKITALDAEAAVGAGVFKNCLKVSYLIGAGDGGGGERFYAPGVGLVFERCQDESSPFEISLTRFSLPGERDDR